MHVELLHLALNEKPGRVGLLVTQGKGRFADVFIKLCKVGDVAFATRVDCADSKRFKSAIGIWVHFCQMSAYHRECGILRRSLSDQDSAS